VPTFGEFVRERYLPDAKTRKRSWERYLTTEEVQRLFDELDRNRNVQVGQVIRLLL
jgi:hypothetical protein